MTLLLLPFVSVIAKQYICYCPHITNELLRFCSGVDLRKLMCIWGKKNKCGIFLLNKMSSLITEVQSYERIQKVNIMPRVHKGNYCLHQTTIAVMYHIFHNKQNIRTTKTDYSKMGYLFYVLTYRLIIDTIFQHLN